jgi:uncharacterized membrane protein YhfC
VYVYVCVCTWSITLNVVEFLLSCYFALRNLSVSCFYILQEELRPFFSLPKVMHGLFDLAKTLFGIDIEPADGLAPVLYCSSFMFHFKLLHRVVLWFL